MGGTAAAPRWRQTARLPPHRTVLRGAPADPAPPTDPMTMSLRRVPVAAALLSFVAWGAIGCRQTRAAQAPPPPPRVSVITVQPERVGLTTEWIATLDGYVNAQIRPQVSGYLIKREY